MVNYDINKIRCDFPILNRKVYNKPLVYFDNGATTQKPQPVIDIVNSYHCELNSSIHRGVHFLSDQATNAYENARETVRRFINANKSSEVIFTSGSTGSINLVAFSFGENFIHEGDEIIISEMEHHANIVPWQLLCERKKSILKVIPFNNNGQLQIENLEGIFSKKTKFLSIIHISNVLGTINPVKRIIEIAHKHDIPVLLDAAQSIQHIPIDVQDLDCDFLVFSGHKIYGPTGIGVLYAKEKFLDQMPPYQGGGDMVDIVTFEKTTFKELPFKFEAGTTNYIGAIGMATALDYICTIGINNIGQYETDLLNYAIKKISDAGDITFFGHAPEKASILSFLINGVHMLDAGMIIDKMGIAVRVGTHCAQPIMQHYNIDGTLRVSIALYNTEEEINYLSKAIDQVKKMFY
jgi:cysteine desulfurase/selenocysteine lyase